MVSKITQAHNKIVLVKWIRRWTNILALEIKIIRRQRNSKQRATLIRSFNNSTIWINKKIQRWKSQFTSNKGSLAVRASKICRTRLNSAIFLTMISNANLNKWKRSKKCKSSNSETSSSCAIKTWSNHRAIWSSVSKNTKKTIKCNMVKKLPFKSYEKTKTTWAEHWKISAGTICLERQTVLTRMIMLSIVPNWEIANLKNKTKTLLSS